VTDTWTADDAATDWCDPRRVALWDAINEYAAACGGDPGNATISGRRMDAVVAVERVMRSYTHATGQDGNRVLVPVRVFGPRPSVPLFGWRFWCFVGIAAGCAAVLLFG
jgi:anti-sigma factor RsiW